jgi:hypothetical protein
MNDPKQEVSLTGGSTQATAGTKKVERIRSSRYEWESKSGESENSTSGAKTNRRSLLAMIAGWLRKGWPANRSDATPSAA